MDADDQPVTRREMLLELRSLKYQMHVVVLTAVVILKFELPTSITVGALSLVAGKAVWSGVAARFGA